MTSAGLGERLETWRYFTDTDSSDLLTGIRSFLCPSFERKIITPELNVKEFIEALPLPNSARIALVSTLHGRLLDQVLDSEAVFQQTDSATDFGNGQMPRESECPAVLHLFLIFATRGDSALAGARFLILTTRLIPPMDGDYTMDHTVLIYLMHRDGKFVASESLAAPGVNQIRLIEGRPDRNRSWRFLFDHENGRESDLKRLAILPFRH